MASQSAFCSKLGTRGPSKQGYSHHTENLQFHSSSTKTHAACWLTAGEEYSLSTFELEKMLHVRPCFRVANSQGTRLVSTSERT